MYIYICLCDIICSCYLPYRRLMNMDSCITYLWCAAWKTLWIDLPHPDVMEDWHPDVSRRNVWLDEAKLLWLFLQKWGHVFFNFEPSSNTEPPKLGFEVQICFFWPFWGLFFFPRDTTRSCLNLYATCYILRTAYLLFLLVYDYDCVCYVLTSECLDMSGLKSIELMLSKFPSVVNR